MSSQPGHYPQPPQSGQYPPQYYPQPQYAPTAPQYASQPQYPQAAPQYAPPAPVYASTPQFTPQPPYHQPAKERLPKLDVAAGTLLLGAVVVALAGSFQTVYRIVYQDSPGGASAFKQQATNWVYQSGSPGALTTRVMTSGFALAVACVVAAVAAPLLLFGAARRWRPIRGLGAVAAGLLAGVGLDNTLSTWDTMRLSDGQSYVGSRNVGAGFWWELVATVLAVVAVLLSVLSLRQLRRQTGYGWQSPAYAPPPPQSAGPPAQHQQQPWAAPQPQYPTSAAQPARPTPPPTIPEQLALVPPQPQPQPQPADASPTIAVPTMPAASLEDSQPTMQVRTQRPAEPAAPQTAAAAQPAAAAEPVSPLTDVVPAAEPVPPQTAAAAQPAAAAEPVSPQTDAVPAAEPDPPQTDAVPPAAAEPVPPQTVPAPPPSPAADQQTHISRIPVEPLPSPAQIREDAADS